MSRIRAALRPESSFRRRLVAALLLATIGSLVFASGAFADFLTPKSGGSPNADQIDSLYKIILYIAIVVFVVVEGALFYSLIKFRAQEGPRRGADPRQHAPGDRLDGRRRADPRRARRPSRSSSSARSRTRRTAAPTASSSPTAC